MMMPGSKGQKAVHACMIRLLTSTSPYKRKVCEEKAFTDFFCADIEKMVLYKTGKSLYN